MDINDLSQSYLKKLKKKILRSQRTVEKDINIKLVNDATKNIVICNCGLSNGLSIETLFENYSKYGPISNLLMIPGKSYCIISYDQVDNAKMAFESTNGLLNIGQDNKPLLLGYIQTLPTINNHYTFDKKPLGLEIIENVLTEEEETAYISFIKDDFSGSSLKHRIVKHFGYEFLYGTNNIDKNTSLKEKIPEFTSKLWMYYDFNPDQLTINCYEPGQGIPPHVDTHSAFEEPIISLSLGSEIVMDFKHEDGRQFSVFLPRRSLAVMSGESRYNWTHGITPRKYDIVPGPNGLTVQCRKLRVSYTFRKIRRQSCICSYPQMCDSQMSPDTQILEDQAIKLECLHVQQVYDQIANHFSDTRHTPWPNVMKFVQSFEIGSLLVDIGCGNGKNLGHNRKIYEVGCDISSGLIELSKEKGLEVFQCNCLSVPLKDSSADGVISIAVIHHLATQSRRRRAIEEIVRMLRNGGRALIYAWAIDQTKEEKSSYLKQDRKNRKKTTVVNEEMISMKSIKHVNVTLPVHTNRKQFAQQDMLVPWKLKGDSNHSNDEFLRFYHVFNDNELANMCKTFPNIELLDYYYDQGNWCAIIQKIN